ncbi:MAG: sigma-54 dependent transcriptional regulator [Bacillota bacterium]
MLRILVVDDEESVCRMLRDLLEAEGFKVSVALHASEALEILYGNQEINAVMVDVRMPDIDGLEFFTQVRREGYTVPVIVMTAYGTTDTAIQAMKLGAFDYVLKPFNIEEVILTVKKAVEVDQMAREMKALRQELAGKAPGEKLEELIGRSAPMHEVYKQIGKFADTDYTILIVGETGTGKELVAGAIHRNSKRRDGPFVRINCAAIPENLLESELFGYEKGAFTGAANRKLGKFELAHGGTLFLDEISEIPLAMQAKLLRVLQEKELDRVGGTKTIKVDARIIVATNRDLSQMVCEGTFRADLFYRLNVVTIQVPPLRERKEDIRLFVNYFIQHASAKLGKMVNGISEEALQLLEVYDWPGNVRELRNICERAVVLTRGMVITPEDIPASLHPDFRESGAEKKWAGQTLQEILSDVERNIVLRVLKDHNYNRTKTAQVLGINRRTLYAKIKEHGLDILLPVDERGE